MSAHATDDVIAEPTRRRRFDTGRLLAGRYEIIELIGEGGTAEVYSARDHRLERMVAVKVLRPQFGQDPDARARFAVEARAAAGLAVPNIVPIYDFGAADDGSLYIVMRLIDGPSLRSVLTVNGRLTELVTIEIARQVAEALAAAHDSGLIHRDVKPGNILIDRLGTAHLTDFGTVKALAGSDQLTRSGMIFGTAAYLAPEQATGGSVDARTDIYALGVVMYEALAGRAPFSGDDPVAVTYRHAHEAPTALSYNAPGIDARLEALVMACLEKDPSRRPANGHALAESLRGLQPVHVPTAASALGIAAIAASVPDPRTSSFVPRPAAAELDKETAPLVPVSAVAPVAAAAVAAAEAPTVATPVAPAGALTLPYGAPAVVPAAPWASAPSRRDKSPWAALVGLLLVALSAAVVLGLAAVVFLRPGDQSGPTPPLVGAVVSPPPATEQPTVPAVVIIVPTAAPLPTDPPAATLEPPVATVEPPAPTTEPPAPTAEPPVATAEPTVAPEPVALTVRIPDRLFVGAYPDRIYRGRSAAWVYGQGTSYSTMTAEFQLDAPVQDASAQLVLVGLDGENPIKNEMSVEVNGVTIYSGPNPLPDDISGQGPGNWGSASLEVPAGILRRQNTITITNLEPTDCTTCPKYVMVDYAELTYTGRP